VEKGSIAICFVEQAIRGLRQRRIDTAPILRAAGIAPHLLSIAQARVSAASYSSLWRLVADALDDEFFGEDSHPMRVGSFAMLCHAVLDCDNLEHAIRRASRFFAIALHETMLILLHGLICWLVGRRVPILHARFAYSEPVYSGEYKMMYSAHLSFDMPATQIEFESRYLALPVVQNRDTLQVFLHDAPENIVLKYKSERSVTAQVRRHLRSLPPIEWPHFDVLAAALHLTGSTLRRRLADEGQSYQGLIDELRRDLAIDGLIHSSQSVSEISAQLGFADPGSFHRAFKKWTGTPPAGYRKMRAAPTQAR